MQDSGWRARRATGSGAEERADPLTARGRQSASALGEAAAGGKGPVVRGVRPAVVAGVLANQGLPQEQERKNIRPGQKVVRFLSVFNVWVVVFRVNTCAVFF